MEGWKGGRMEGRVRWVSRWAKSKEVVSRGSPVCVRAITPENKLE